MSSDEVVVQTRPRVPATVIVDSRNVWGSSRSVFGVGRQVSVEGIRKCLALYGFEAEQVFVAIGTEGLTAHPSDRLKSALATNAGYAAKIAAHPRGDVLHGRLVQRGRDVEEKLVDVQCAIQIARTAHEMADGRSTSRVIIVFSEDMDLIPAYRFARDLGVRVYAASHATVDTRPDSRWLYLPEGALREAVGRPDGRYVGHDLRRKMSAMATAPNSVRVSMKVRGFDRPGNRLHLSHNTGATAVWRNIPAGLDVHPGAQHQVYVHDLVIESEQSSFPIFYVDGRPPAGPSTTLLEAIVVRWTAPGRVELRFPGGNLQRVRAPLGSVLPGCKVLVRRDQQNGQAVWRLLGALDSPSACSGCTDACVPLLTRVIGSASTPGARVRAVLLDTGQEVTLQPPGADLPRAGHEYAAVPIAKIDTPQGSHVITVAVSSRLG